MSVTTSDVCETHRVVNIVAMQVSQVLLFVVAAVTSTYATQGGHYFGGEVHSGGHHIDYHAHPKYHYDYAVHDLHTGDVKNKWETRDGDVVKGGYSLNEPDGTIRKVEYTADKHNGFNAVVKRIGKAFHPEPVHHYGGGHIEGGHFGAGGQLGGDGGAAFGGGHIGGGQLGGDGGAAFGGGHFGGGHLGATSYANVNNYAISHHGGHHY